MWVNIHAQPQLKFGLTKLNKLLLLYICYLCIIGYCHSHTRLQLQYITREPSHIHNQAPPPQPTTKIKKEEEEHGWKLEIRKKIKDNKKM